MHRLALFDIDQTLLQCSAHHADAFSFAFKTVYNIETNINTISSHGMTDQQIIIEVLTKKGLCLDEITQKLGACMDAMSSYFESLQDELTVVSMPGSRDLLDMLVSHAFDRGLVTGNLERIAHTKLERAGMRAYFKAGGFGSDGLLRENLIRIALARLKKTYDATFLFGDTPSDIAAANHAGVISIGVATGDYSVKDLREAGAVYVVKNLVNTRQILNLLLSHNNP
ncbi:haloacid dehalogenase [archaeon CG10_big_fil_rev_8_21_14_0_10_43_11]|nr:MAG: haloacid dehalogenase [archaeon CG10_big_fil_rev_8_21_14_0_10_43_11]